MKTILLPLLSVMLLTTVSCRQDRDNVALQDKASDARGREANLSPLRSLPGKTAWFPVGTKFDQAEAGIQSTPPKGWAYIGTTTGGMGLHLQSNAVSTLTCTCNAKGTCKPFRATGPWGTTQGCVGTCTDCTMKQSTGSNKVALNSGGYYLPGAPTRLLKNGETAPAVFKELTGLPEFRERLAMLYQTAYGGHRPERPLVTDDGTISAPEGFVLAGASILGRGLIVILPAGFVRSELGYVPKAKASCSCSNGTGTCKLQDKSILGMGSMWCEGTCNGCTLTTESSVSSGMAYRVSLMSVAL